MGETYTTDEDEKQRSVYPCRRSNIRRVSDMIPRRPSRIEENQGCNHNGHDNFHTISTEDLVVFKKKGYHPLEDMKIIHQFNPIAYKLAPTLYVVGENAMLNWKARNDQDVQFRCDGGDGSRSLLDQAPNLPLSSSPSLLLSVRMASTKARGLEKASRAAASFSLSNIPLLTRRV
jgi:hypothetical protein